MTRARLELSRAQILAHRQAAGHLTERLPSGADSLRRAAWVGLQDSMPRAALLSIHARVEGTEPSTWADPALIQLWGPRYSTYVVAASDHALFTLGRLPDEPMQRRKAEDAAARLHSVLDRGRMRDRDAGQAAGVNPNSFRFAAPTGTVLIRWDGARAPIIWGVPRPDVEPGEARRELARRYVHVFGPTTAEAFGEWAGIGGRSANETIRRLEPELALVRTPLGDAWILASDEASFRPEGRPPARARLLPSGDAYWLLWGRDRELLVPDPRQRAELWTPRVWPGALLIAGEVTGTWRRADADIAIRPWRGLSDVERTAVEAEAASLPLPGVAGRLHVRWVN